MKKKVLIWALAVMTVISLFLFAGCKKGSDKIPEIKSDSDKVITSEVNSSPSESTPKDALYISLGKLSALDSYRTESKGSAVSTIAGGLFNYVQKNDCGMIKSGDKYYTFSNSYSKFVSVKHEAFGKGDNVAYRKNGKEIVNTSAIAYKEVYGVLPTKLLSGHVFNDETIKSAELTESANGNYVFKIVLDKEKGNVLLYKQMKEFGKLNGYPVFTDDTVAYLTVKEDYTPVKFSYESKYKVNVSVLGEIPCTEKNEVVFYDINGKVSIPDEAAFDEAVTEKPSVIVPTEEKPVDKASEKIVAALLKSDIKNGVALTGNLRYNGLEVPVKINAKADLDTILNDDNADIASLIDVKLSLGTYEDVFSVVYHDGKIYLSLGSVKIATDVVSVGGEDGSDDDSSGGISSIIGSLDPASLIKIEEDGAYYTIRLNDFKIDVAIKTALRQLGLAGDNVDSAYDLNVKLYIPSDRIGNISFGLKTDIIDCGAKFNLSEEEFPVPDINDYVYEPETIKFGAEADVSAFGFNVHASAKLSYDILKPSAKALKAEVNITLDSSLKSLLSLAGGISGDIPVWVEKIGKADSLNIVVDGDKVMFVALKDGKPSFATEIAVSGESKENVEYVGDGGTDVGIDFNAFLEFMLGAVERTDEEGKAAYWSVKEDMMPVVNAFWKQVPEMIILKAGKTVGKLFGSYVGKPLASVGAEVNAESNFAKIIVMAYDVAVGNGDVYIDGRDYATTELLAVSLQYGLLDEYTFAWDSETLYNDIVAAKRVIDMVEAVKNPYLDVLYKERVLEAEDAYAALTAEQKVLVYDVSGEKYFADLIKKGNNLFTEVENFAKAVDLGLITVLNGTYNSFSKEQKAYFEQAYPAEAEKYFAKRTAAEKDYTDELIAFTNNLTVYSEASLKAMSGQQISELFATYTGVYEKYATLCTASLAKIDTAKFEAETRKVVKAYAEYVIGLSDKAKLEMVVSSDKSVEELLALYSKYDGFNAAYRDGIEKKAIVKLVDEIAPEYASKCYIVDYYLKYNGSYFRKHAVLAIEAEIENLKSLKASGANAFELAPRFDNVDALLEKTDSSAVSNLGDYKTLKNDSLSELKGLLKTELPAITNKLKAVNSDPKAGGIDWKGLNAEVAKYRDGIERLSITQKTSIATEITKFKIAASSFDKNYASYGA